MNGNKVLVAVFAVLISLPAVLSSFGADVVSETPGKDFIALYHTASPDCNDHV